MRTFKHAPVYIRAIVQDGGKMAISVTEQGIGKHVYFYNAYDEIKIEPIGCGLGHLTPKRKVELEGEIKRYVKSADDYFVVKIVRILK